MKKVIQKLAIGLIASFLLISLTQSIFQYRDKVGFYNDIKEEHEKVTEQNKKLKSDQKRAKDYYFVERQIRERLNLLQEDEISVIIPDITPSPTPSPPVDKEPYELWLDLVLKKAN